MTQTLTGYPSIDKPWTKYYREKVTCEIDVEQSIYEVVFNSNKDNMSAKALEYMGTTWSFEKLKKETDKAAAAFLKSGLNIGDVVLIGVSNCPEVVVILLALNKIGVITKWFDVRASEKDIEVYANSSKCRYIVAFDLLLPKLQMILDATKMEKALIIYPTDSLAKHMQILYSFKANHLPKDKRYIRFKEFVKQRDVNAGVVNVTLEKNTPSIMVQSSGTTGKPKSIVHSNYSVNSSTRSLAFSDLPIERGKTVLNALPPWIAYALGHAIIYPLTLGACVRMCPTFEPEIVMENLGNFTMAFAAPFHYRYVRDHFNEMNKKQREGLRCIDALGSGGDKLSSEENRELESIFGTTLVNGYGNNEAWGCLTVNPILHNKYGSVGIPIYDEIVIAYDNDTKEELPYGEVGEICALANTMFLHYEGDSEATNAVKKIHSDGKLWLHTGDLGFIDEEGFVTLCGRMRRVIVRSAFKISAYTIEDKICEHPAVKECVAVEVKDEKEEHVPMAYIVLKEDAGNIDNVKKSIVDKCCSELKEYEIPKYFRIVDSLPYTQNGKYDFRMLETLGNEFVDNQEE